MRFTFIVVLCLALAACVLAEDFVIGERTEGDILVTNRRIWKPKIWNIPMIAHLGAKTPSASIPISYVNVTSLDDTEPQIILIRGGLGERSVYLMAIGKAGEGLNLLFTVYAKQPDPTTTAEPSTADPSTPEPSTEGPSSTEATTVAPSSTEGAPTQPDLTTAEGTSGSPPATLPTALPTVTNPPAEGTTSEVVTTTDSEQPTNAQPTSTVGVEHPENPENPEEDPIDDIDDI